jgi:hypothetical protein
MAGDAGTQVHEGCRAVQLRFYGAYACTANNDDVQ